MKGIWQRVVSALSTPSQAARQAVLADALPGEGETEYERAGEGWYGYLGGNSPYKGAAW